MSATEVTVQCGIDSAIWRAIAGSKIVTIEADVVVVVAHEQRHPDREAVAPRGHADDVRALVERLAHALVVRIDQEADVRAARFERLVDLLHEVALAHQEDAHAADPIQVWRDLRASRNGCRLPKSPLRNRLLPQRRTRGVLGMQFGMRFARASALTATVAMATIVGTASADLRPPVADGSTAAVGKSAALAAPLPAVPTFVNGLAQPVFAATAADWVNHELWVESTFDSDRDGKNDRIHVDVSRPQGDRHRRPEGPGHLRGQPVLRGRRGLAELLRRARARPAAGGARPRAVLHGPAARARRSAPIYESYFVPRGYAVVHAESPGSGHSDGCTTSGGTQRDARRHGRHRLAQRPRQGLHDPRRHRRDRRVDWHNGKTAMMGTSYNGTIPIAAATTGVQGLEAIVPVAAISDWYDYYRANGLVRAPHSATGGQNGNNGYLGEDLDVLAEYTYSRADEHPGPRTKCWPIIDEITAGRGPASRATATRPGTSATT